MTCPTCAHETPPAARWCPDCGSSTTPAPTHADDTPADVTPADVTPADVTPAHDTPAAEATANDPSPPRPRSRRPTGLLVAAVLTVPAGLLAWPAPAPQEPAVVDTASSAAGRDAARTGQTDLDLSRPMARVETLGHQGEEGWGSLVLGPAVVIAGGMGEPSFLVALDRATGAVLWTEPGHVDRVEFVGGALRIDGRWHDPRTGAATAGAGEWGAVLEDTGEVALVRSLDGLRVHLVDREGVTRWSLDVPGNGTTERVLPDSASIHDGAFILATHDSSGFGRQVWMGDLATGVLGEVPLPLPPDITADVLLLGEGRVLTMVHEEEQLPRVSILDGVTGRPVTSASIAPSQPGWAEARGPVVVLTADDRSVLVFDRNTLALLWEAGGEDLRLWAVANDAPVVPVRHGGTETRRVMDLRDITSGRSDELVEADRIAVDGGGWVAQMAAVVFGTRPDGSRWHTSIPGIFPGVAVAAAPASGAVVLAGGEVRIGGHLALTARGESWPPTVELDRLARFGALGVAVADGQTVATWTGVRTWTTALEREVTSVVASGPDVWALTEAGLHRLAASEGSLVDRRALLRPDDVSVAGAKVVVRASQRLVSLAREDLQRTDWDVEVPGACGAPTLWRDVTAVPTLSGVTFLDASGEVTGLWDLGAPTCEGLAVADGRFVAAAGNTLWLGNPGNEPTPVDLDGEVVGAPLTSGPVVLVATSRGLVAVQETVLWALVTDMPPLSGPVALEDGRLALPMADSTVTILAPT